MGDGIWRAARLDTGGPDAKQWPGWYATRTPVPAEPVAGEKRGLIVTYVGPFDGEAAARAYCDERNPPGALLPGSHHEPTAEEMLDEILDSPSYD